MAQDTQLDKALEKTAPSGIPNVHELSRQYRSALNTLGTWLTRQDRNTDIRRTRWSGQSDDGRKWTRNQKDGLEVTPWDGASDQRIPLADEQIIYHISMGHNAVRKAQITAIPSNGNNMARASIAGNVARWMIGTLVEEYFDVMDMAAGDLLEHGFMVTGQFYAKEDKKTTVRLGIDTMDEETYKLLLSFAGIEIQPENEIATASTRSAIRLRLKKVALSLGSVEEDLKKPVLDEMIESLLSKGEAFIPIVSQKIDRPIIMRFKPSKDIIFPRYTRDPQKVPYIFVNNYMTPQALRSGVRTGELNEKWVNMVIEQYKGKWNTEDDSSIRDAHGAYAEHLEHRRKSGLIKVVRAFQILTDKNNVSGVYETVFHELLTEGTVEGRNRKNLYGKHELLGYAHGEYPFTVTTLDENTETIYDSRSVPEICETWQNQYKREVDMTTDASNMAVLPPLAHPYGRCPKRWGPGVKYAYRISSEEVRYADSPKMTDLTISVRDEIRRQSDQYFGRKGEFIDEVEAMSKQQYFIDKVLSHAKKAMTQMFVLLQQFGPSEIQFSVAGVPDPQVWSRDKPDEEFRFYLTFNQLEADPERMEKVIDGIIKIKQMDTQGRIGMNELIDVAMELISPVIAQRVLLSQEDSQAEGIEQFNSIITNAHAGLDVDFPPTGPHELWEQLLQVYVQDNIEAIQADEKFKEKIEKLHQELQFQRQQRTTNAMAGRIGGKPGPFNSFAPEQIQQQGGQQ